MLLAEFTPAQKEALMRLAHSVVVSDGDLTTSEMVMMKEMRREMGLAADFEATYLDTNGIEKIFDSQRARAIALISLIRIAYADGAFEIEEQCFLRELADQFEIAPARFGLIDNWVRRLIALENEIIQLI